MDKQIKIDTNFLYIEKERIYKMIEGFFHEQNFQEKLNSFESQSFIYEGKNILMEMGKVLRDFTIKYLDDNKLIKEEEKRSFAYYFWPGFSTIENKRISIWGSDTERKTKYTTGIGWIGWDKNSEEFRNCPTTIAYDQVLIDKNFDGYNFYPGSTHCFRVNQSKRNNGFQKSYLKLRVPNTDYVFKALHVTIDEHYKEDDSLYHTLLIKIPQTDIKDSGFIVKKQLKAFLEYNREYNKVKDEKGDSYLWEWPFNVLPYEEKYLQRNIDPENIIDLCKKDQERDIDIQAHLYSYWIAATLGNGNTFHDETNIKIYKDELHQLLIKDKDRSLLPWKDKLGFLNLIDKEKERIKAVFTYSNKPEDIYKETCFNHWYTLYHEGITAHEDLGSTMFLTNHELPLELLFHVASWIEDIYTNLKLVESKARSKYHTRQDDFSSLYHIQGPLFRLFEQYFQMKNCNELIPIVKIMDCALKIVSNINDHEKLLSEITLSNSKENLHIDEIIRDSIKEVNLLCNFDIFLSDSSMFGINNEDQRNIIKRLASKDELIKINSEDLEQLKGIKIESYKQLFEILIIEILINSVKHSDKNKSDLDIKILVDNTNCLRFQNSSNLENQVELDNKIKNTKRMGLMICKNIADALNIEYQIPSIDNYIATVKIKIK